MKDIIDKKDEEVDGFIPITVSEESRKSTLSLDSNKKIWNYFISIVKDPSFQRSINAIRKYSLKEDGTVKDYKKLCSNINNFCRNWALDETSWRTHIENYIIHNELPSSSENFDSCCIVFDRIEVGEDEYSNGYTEDDDDYFNYVEPVELEPWSYSHPVILRINPYASQREIIDYIKKFYNLSIKPIQDYYKIDNIKLGSVKKKDPKKQERNNFIYENKDLPRAEIASLVGKKFKEYLDVGHVGKIISLEKKKREGK